MPVNYARGFPRDFPRLGDRYQKKSHHTDQYNCIAWAAGECHRPWWPGNIGPEIHWPPNLPADVTIENFTAAFGLVGYITCVGAHREWRFEKVAIYVNRKGEPTHAARQSILGGWTSKLGQNIDIKHATLEVLEGGIYGSVAQIMKRHWTIPRIIMAILLRLKTFSQFRREPL
jgi:hypothetical protein